MNHATASDMWVFQACGNSFTHPSLVSATTHSFLSLLDSCSCFFLDNLRVSWILSHCSAYFCLLRALISSCSLESRPGIGRVATRFWIFSFFSICVSKGKK